MKIIDAGLGKRGGQLARTLLARRTSVSHQLASMLRMLLRQCPPMR
jgi:hypothetical protein